MLKVGNIYKRTLRAGCFHTPAEKIGWIEIGVIVRIINAAKTSRDEWTYQLVTSHGIRGEYTDNEDTIPLVWIEL